MAKLESNTVAALKKLCKEAKVAQSGEKPDLVARLKQHAAGTKLLIDGVNPASLPAGVLKKQLATRGLPCSTDLESRDILVGRLIDALKAESGGGGGGGDASGGGGGAAADDPDEAIRLAVSMAKRVLELGEGGDAEGVLSLLGQPITRSTSFAAQRKAYLSLARLIHPDKLSKAFDGATRAFQELVRAFDELTAPPAAETGAAAKAKDGSKAKAIARSNANCFRTSVSCPRCGSQWGLPDSGVQPYDYNFMMQGLKLYCCALCLCEFGCVSAKHKCPICRKLYAYHPKDYHRQVECGNPKCKGSFGFMCYHVSPRVEEDLRVEIKQTQEKRAKQREASAARLARAQRKQAGVSAAEAMRQAEACFVRGLTDACPRCGYEPSASCADRESLEEHLRGCTDAGSHAAHRKQVELKAAAVDKKRARADDEAEAQNLAHWQFLGSSTEQMWLLTDKQLAIQCKDAGISPDDDRNEMLVALAQHRKAGSHAQLTDKSGGGGGGGGGGGSGAGPSRPSAETIPTNLHTMSLQQLRGVCAAHGIRPTASTTQGLIAQIEGLVYAGTDAAPLLLQEAKEAKEEADKEPGKGAKPKPKPKPAAPKDSSDSDSPYDAADSSDSDVPLAKRPKPVPAAPAPAAPKPKPKPKPPAARPASDSSDSSDEDVPLAKRPAPATATHKKMVIKQAAEGAPPAPGNDAAAPAPAAPPAPAPESPPAPAALPPQAQPAPEQVQPEEAPPQQEVAAARAPESDSDDDDVPLAKRLGAA